MRIASNPYALRAQSQLQRTTQMMARALERLSSGNRINSARDDAAGLALATSLEAQSRGLKAGILNLNQANGFLSTADGALQTQVEIVHRMRELALQASNGTLSSQDRSNLQKEFNVLIDEFDRIAQQASFNGEALLNGSFSTRNIQVGSNAGESIALSMIDSRASSIFTRVQTSSVPGGPGGPDGSFGRVQDIKAGSNFGRAHFEDGTGDGVEDIFFSNGTQFNIYLGDGGSSGSYSYVYGIDHGLRSDVVTRADLDGDGVKDLVAFDANFNVLYSKLSLGDILNYDVSTTADNSVTQDVTAMRALNGDGDTYGDVVTLDNGNNWAMYYGNTGAGLSAGTTKINAAGGSILAIAAGDVTGDGMDDVIVTDDQGGLRLATDLASQSATYVDFVASTNLTAVEIVDWDGDSDLDIVGTGGNVLELWLNDGIGNFTQDSVASVDTGDATALDIADIDQDGNLDVAIASTNTPGAIKVYYNLVDGAFQSTGGFETGASTIYGLSINDTNLDSALDILIDSDNGILSVLGGFATAMDGSEANTVSAVGDLDLLTQDAAQDTLELLDTGLRNLLQARSTLGAQLNRLDYAQSNSQSSLINLSSALSQARDVDMASETAELIRLQVLQQAQVATLAQSQIAMSLVLNLLR